MLGSINNDINILSSSVGGEVVFHVYIKYKYLVIFLLFMKNSSIKFISNIILRTAPDCLNPLWNLDLVLLLRPLVFDIFLFIKYYPLKDLLINKIKLIRM